MPLNGLLHGICHRKRRSQIKWKEWYGAIPATRRGTQKTITDCGLVESGLYGEHIVQIFLKVFT